MIFLGGVIGLIALAVWIFCIIDVITTPAGQVRLLPKLAWLAIVVLLVEFGAIAWLFAGRPWNAKAMSPGAPRAGGGAGSGLGFSGTATQRRRPARPSNPDDDDEFLAGLAEQQRKRDHPDDGPAQPA